MRKNDEIFFHEKKDYSSLLGEKDFIVLPWKADVKWEVGNEKEILVLPGHEWDLLTKASKDNFLMTSFVITQQSDRMGYRLNNIPMHTISSEEIVSSAVSFGTIQLLPDGQIDRFDGGSPNDRRLSENSSYYFSASFQSSTDETRMIKFIFRFTDQQTAEDLLVKQQQHLLQLQNACKFRLEEFLNANEH